MKKKSKTRGGESTALKVLHRTACILGTLKTSYCLLRIILSVVCAFDDLELYSDLGCPYPLGYYLKEEWFAETIFTFLGVFAEFWLYLLLCRRAKKGKPLPWGKPYSKVMPVIHVVMFVLTSLIFIWIPYQSPIRKPLDEITENFRAFATLSVLPAALYSIAYLIRVRKLTSKEEPEDE